LCRIIKQACPLLNTALPEDSAEREMNLLAMIQREDPPGDPFLPEEVMQYFTET